MAEDIVDDSNLVDARRLLVTEYWVCPVCTQPF